MAHDPAAAAGLGYVRVLTRRLQAALAESMHLPHLQACAIGCVALGHAIATRDALPRETRIDVATVLREAAAVYDGTLPARKPH